MGKENPGRRRRWTQRWQLRRSFLFLRLRTASTATARYCHCEHDNPGPTDGHAMHLSRNAITTWIASKPSATVTRDLYGAGNCHRIEPPNFRKPRARHIQKWEG